MGAAHYVGRVGGLAVALGVGTAIATGHGIAVAETTDSQSESTNSEQSTDTSESTGSATDSKPAESDTDETTTSTTVTGGVTVRAQTNTSKDAAPTDDLEPTEDEEPTEETPEEPSEEAGPTEEPAAEAEPTEEPTAEPTPTNDTPPAREPAAKSDSTESTKEPKASASTVQPTATRTATDTEALSGPADMIQKPAKVAVFADARKLAAAEASTLMALSQPLTTAATPAAPSLPNLFTSVVNVVKSTINWILNPLAGLAPTTPVQPPLIWSLLAFARREFETFANALTGRTSSTTQQPMAALALAATPTTPLYSPWPNPQVSPSTEFVAWVTGNYVYPNDPETGYTDLIANTWTRYTVGGTDLGIMWDNGIPDDPSTPDINEHQVLIIVGDTFADGNMSVDWRSNTLFRSSDTDLSNGMEIPNGQWYTGNMFGGAPLGPDGYPNRARQVIWPEGLPAGITLIPTAGISVPDPDSRFGAIQYVSFMSVTNWGAPGTWTTNYSAIAWSDDNGETFHVAPETVRYNQPWSGNQNFQQMAFVRPGDGYVYVYGTPNGRQGAAHLARVPEQEILDLSKYEYWDGGSKGWLFGIGARPAGWKKNAASATPVFGVDRGACGVGKAGNQVSEMSVQYNQTLGKYVVLYGDQFNNIVMRTADSPEGKWSSATVLMKQQNGGIYAPMMHPWSPSTLGTGTELYWNLSLWSEYNVMLMKTDLSKV